MGVDPARLAPWLLAALALPRIVRILYPVVCLNALAIYATSVLLFLVGRRAAGARAATRLTGW